MHGTVPFPKQHEPNQNGLWICSKFSLSENGCRLIYNRLLDGATLEPGTFRWHLQAVAMTIGEPMAAKSGGRSKSRPASRRQVARASKPKPLEKAGQKKAGRSIKKRALLVLGMHRSGTSAVTRVCNLLGVELGSNMMPPRPDNQEGFWENSDICLAHEEFLAEIGSSWDDYRALPEGWQSHRAVAKCRKRITAILKKELAHSSFWCIKDPRVSRLVPLWLPVLEELGCAPTFLLVCRNPLEVAGSLAIRNSFPVARSELLWLRHLIDAELATRDYPRAFLTYEALLGDWRRTMSRVAATLAMTWPNAASSVGAEIDTFLQQRLRHQAVDDVIVEGDRRLSRWIRDSYRACKEAADGDDALLRGILTTTASDLETVAPLLEPWVRGLEIELAKSKATIEEHKAEVDSLNDAKAALQGELERISAELSELREIVVEREHQIGHLQNEYSGAQAGNVRRDGRIDALSVQLWEAQEALAERDRKLGGVQSALSSAGEDLDKRVHELSQARAEITARERRIDILSGQLSELRGVVVERSQETDRMQTALSREREHIAERDERLEEFMETLSRARSDIAKREAQIEVLSGELAEARKGLADRDHRLEQAADELSQALHDKSDLLVDIGAVRAALAERDSVVDGLLHSTSWRITSPVRATMRSVRWLGRGPRALVGRTARAIYRRLPISYTKKIRLKNFVYGTFGFLIGGTATYRDWQKGRQTSGSDPTAALAPQGGLAMPSGELEPVATSDLALAVAPEVPLVSIVIPVYNQLDYTLRCLKSLQQHPSRHSAEIIVVDDGSHDSTADALKKMPGVKYVRNDENQGFIRTCNRGASVARGAVSLVPQQRLGGPAGLARRTSRNL